MKTTASFKEEYHRWSRILNSEPKPNVKCIVYGELGLISKITYVNIGYKKRESPIFACKSCEHINIIGEAIECLLEFKEEVEELGIGWRETERSMQL